MGTKAARAKLLYQFLSSTECDELYLVGDIIDLWAISRKAKHWKKHHTLCIETILQKSVEGTKVIFLPGNHDEGLFPFSGKYGNIILREKDQVLLGGKTILVLHGHQFDGFISSAKWLHYLGAHCYNWLIDLNRIFNYFRRKLGLPYWSLSQKIKRSVKKAINTVNKFEIAATQYAAAQHCNGVLVGHIHWAFAKQIGDSQYINTGDWVEDATFVAEDFDGRVALYKWDGEPKLLAEIFPKDGL